MYSYCQICFLIHWSLKSVLQHVSGSKTYTQNHLQTFWRKIHLPHLNGMDMYLDIFIWITLRGIRNCPRWSSQSRTVISHPLGISVDPPHVLTISNTAPAWSRHPKLITRLPPFASAWCTFQLRSEATRCRTWNQVENFLQDKHPVLTYQIIEPMLYCS